MVAHALLARVVKALLWAWSPLATGEAEACTYQRRVYCTADRKLWPVVCVAGGAGVAWGLGLVWHSSLSSWLMLVGVLGVLAALAMDLQRWERVAVSGNSVWFQRGLGHTVHQVLIGNIRDVQVQECKEGGFTLRHGHRNRSARLSLLTGDKRLVSLPKTDAFSGADAVENMANFLRLRLQQIREAAQEKAEQGSAVKPAVRLRDVSRSSSVAVHQPPPPPPQAIGPAASSVTARMGAAPQTQRSALQPTPIRRNAPPLLLHPVGKPPPDDEELLRALQRLRRQGTETQGATTQTAPTLIKVAQAGK